jgi:DNA-directed RNA polymerase specialized sigma24 family protein
VASSEEWAEVAELIRQEGGPSKSRAVAQLYKYAQKDGPWLIRSFEKELGKGVLEELTHALLAEKLDEIVYADNPKALFRTSLVRRAISWRRRGDAAVMPQSTEPLTPKPISGSTGHGESRDLDEDAERHRFVHDAHVILGGLSERDRQIVVAVGLGEDREGIARAFKTTRANVDQIVSRVRKQLKGGAS